MNSPAAFETLSPQTGRPSSCLDGARRATLPVMIGTGNRLDFNPLLPARIVPGTGIWKPQIELPAGTRCGDLKTKYYHPYICVLLLPANSSLLPGWHLAVSPAKRRKTKKKGRTPWNLPLEE